MVKFLCLTLSLFLIFQFHLNCQSDGSSNSIQEFVQKESKFVNSKGRGNLRPLIIAVLRSTNNTILQNLDEDTREIHLEHLANRLSILGFNPGNITSLSNQDISVVDAIMAGPDASIKNQTILSEVVVEASITSFNQDVIGDGYGLTIKCDITRMFKKDKNRKSLMIRLHGYLQDNKIISSEWTPEIGEKFILFISPSLYEFYANLQNPEYKPKSEYVLLQWNPIKILENGRLAPVYPSPINESTTYDEVVELVQTGIK